MKKTSHFSLFVAAVIMIQPIFSFAQGNNATRPFKEVDVKVLKENMRNYWASGISFYDALVEIPIEKAIRVDKKNYYRFATKELGDCYADKELAEKLRFARLDQDFVFAGTVLRPPRKDYIVVLKDATAALDEDEATAKVGIDDLIEGFERENSDLKPLSDFLKKSLTGLLGYSQSESMAIEELLAADSEQLGKLKGIVRKSLNSIEQENGTTSTEILIAYTLHLMAEKYGAAPTPEQVEEFPQVARNLSNIPMNYFDSTLDPVSMAQNRETIQPEKPLTVLAPPHIPPVVSAPPVRPVTFDPPVNPRPVTMPPAKTYRPEPKQVATRKVYEPVATAGMDKYDLELQRRLAEKEAKGLILPRRPAPKPAIIKPFETKSTDRLKSIDTRDSHQVERPKTVVAPKRVLDPADYLNKKANAIDQSQEKSQAATREKRDEEEYLGAPVYEL